MAKPVSIPMRLWDTIISRQREAVVLLVALLIVVGIWGFVELADEVKEGDVQSLDESIVRALRRADDPRVPIGPHWVEETARDITALGSVPVLWLLVFAVSGFLFLERIRHAMWLVLGAALSGAIVSSLIKMIVARERPSIVPHLTNVSDASFPSGHSMLAAVLYLTLGVLLVRLTKRKRVKAFILFMALLLTFLVGVSRVYLGVHYPTDVLAGWTAGLVWALACWLVARYLQKRGAVEPEQ